MLRSSVMVPLLGRARGARAARFALGLISTAVLATPRPAAAYCRTTTQAIPPDYSPTRGCFTSGHLLFWRNACVTYSVNEAGSRSIPFSTAQAIIDKSFGHWMGVACPASGEAAGITVINAGSVACGEVKFNKIGRNQNVIVFRDDSWPYLDANSTLGLTTVTFNSDNGEMFDADMEINASGRNLSATDTVPTNGFDLESVITHEAGHFFGLAHATDQDATMFASYKPGRSDLRSLEADDANGLCAIYPDDQTRVVSPAANASGTLKADACKDEPIGGFTRLCTETTPPDEGCSAAPAATFEWASLTPLCAFGLAGALARRRARRARQA